ncbi:uncharacterized protein DSM5745_05993 [Aspergillus mulundensis]|uniref:Uncharacterized protein n=1 Tax=Aspergillus mulundensis TaxID=1810919 RepID=A0A3D8RZ80_9EURO|nr:hypothetical protein DSM5745_05993 [Aspergillus mulundensis]RDW79141.1 hypothetical protein DSM5745_05993 [Aspergillus mulundensis]
MSSHDENEDKRASEFNPELCATLYNRIIQIGFKGSKLEEQGDRIITSWFEGFKNDPALQECRNLFPAPLVTFLEQANVIVDKEGRPRVPDALLHHVEVLATPGDMLIIDQYSAFTEKDECIILMRNNVFGEYDCAGVVMDLQDLSVCYRLDAHDVNVSDPESPGTTWYMLEEFLDHWLFIIEVEKYKAVVPGTEKCNPSGSLVQRWDVAPWNPFILRQSLDAWNSLVEAISARLPEQCHHQAPPQVIADDFLPEEIKGFPRAFLQAASKPPFKFIAPGLTIYNPNAPPHLPYRDPQTMRYDTPNFDMRYKWVPDDANALILFPAEGHLDAEAGLWIAPDEGWADTVRLALPYSIESYPDSEGKRVKHRQPTYGSKLWQHGECPFFIQHSTRLSTMLHRWRKLVEDGIWTVDEHGVQGGIEFYRQAEDPAKADWFCLRDVCFDWDEIYIALD